MIELSVAPPPAEVSSDRRDSNQAITIQTEDIVDQTTIENQPIVLTETDLNTALSNPNPKLAQSSPILIANPTSSIHTTNIHTLSKSLPIAAGSLSDTETQFTLEDTVECATATDDHYYSRRRTESAPNKPEVTPNDAQPEVITLEPLSTPTTTLPTANITGSSLKISGLTLPSLDAQTTPTPFITVPKPEADIKRFFLQRHPDGRLLLVPFETLVTAASLPAQLTTVQQPEVEPNPSPPVPRSPLFRISLADSSTAFPLLSNPEVSEPLVIATAILPPPQQQPEVANEQPQLSISVPELLVVNSSATSGESAPASVSVSASPSQNRNASGSVCSSLPSNSSTSTNTMTSYIFAQQATAGPQQHQQPAVPQQQSHPNSHAHNSPLPPVETIFSVSDSHYHPSLAALSHQMAMSNNNGGHAHQAQQPQNGLVVNRSASRQQQQQQQFDEFDPFGDMGEQQFTPTAVINDHHIDYYGQVDSTTTLIEDDDEDEMLSASKCLPFGYYYDDQKMFNKLEMISSSLPSSTTSSSSPLLDALELNDLFTSTNTNNTNNPPATNHHQQQPPHPHSHAHQPQQQGGSQPMAIQLSATPYHAPHHHHAPHLHHQTHIKQEFTNGNNAEQFQAFHAGYGQGYGMAGYGQDPLISGRLSKATTPTDGDALMKADDPDVIKDEADEEMLAMMGWPEPLTTGQAQGQFAQGPVAHNTISSTSSPTVVNEFWLPNGGQSALQSPTIATTSNGNGTGTGTGIPDGQMFEDLLVPDLDDGSLEIESILSSQNQMFGSPPKLSNCLMQGQGKDSGNPNFARPAFVRQQQQQQAQHPTVLGELLLRDNAPGAATPTTNSSYLPQGSILVLPPKTQPSDQLIHHQQQSPTATIHHRPQAPTPMQQAQPRTMQSNCPTLAALITRPTATLVSQPQPIPQHQTHHHQSQHHHPASQTQPLHLRTIIAHEMALHGSARNRNNSMSTDISISSHDEGFASQQEDGSESDESAILSLPPEPDTMEGEMFYMNMGSSATSQPIPIHHPNHGQMAPCMFQQQASTSFDESDMLHHHHHQHASVSDDEEEEEDDDDDESFYGDYNAEDLLGATTSDDVNNKWSLNMGRSRKGNEKRFFWQYNVQSKGPKAPKYSAISVGGSLDTDSEDPHVFKETADPVFADDCQIEGVKHSGKARRGDGNDLTPNPKKLLMIGLELKKLSKIINDLTPVTDVPAPSRDKTRKEKNKLASRACRLKKKAQHEANKIKLHGLHREHSKLMRTISDMRKVIQWNMGARDQPMTPKTPSTCVLHLAGAECHVSPATDVQALMQDTVARNRPLFSVSSHTADFVNHVLDNVSAGVANGGIDEV